MDPCDLLIATDITNKIPANFYTQLESKKWSERKEALDIVEKVTKVPKIQPNDLNDLVRVLKKTIAKDSNIVVVLSAAKCLCQLAQGLGTHFAPYANSCLPILFEKFKEKKPNVISVIRDAADAVIVGTNLEEIFEDVIKFLDNKNPQIKSEMALFLARTFANFPAQVLNKKILRPLINALIKTLSDMDSTVRDNSAMAIGTAMKITGENLMMSLIGDVEPIKVTKIKEFCEKAQIVDTAVNGKTPASTLAITNGQQSVASAETNGTDDGGDGEDENSIYEMIEAVDISHQIQPTFYSQIESKKWSERKEALDVIEKITMVPKIQPTDFNDLVRVLKKTIAKDSNIVVVMSAAKCLCQLAQGLRNNFSPHANSCLPILFEKFKEKKPNVISVIRDAADAVIVGTNLEEIFEDVIKFLDNKNPQIKSEMALFLARTFANFPAQVLNKKILRPLINALIKTLSDMDSTVRDNSAMAIGTAMKVLGENLMMPMIADVEPIKVTKIKEFCEKAQVKKVSKAALAAAAPPPPPSIATVSQPPPSRSTSSATMVRSTSNKRLPPKVNTKLPPPANQTSNATVKRTATIIKRSTMSKRVSAPQQQPVASNTAPSIQSQAPNLASTTALAPVLGAIQQSVHPSTPVMPTYSTSQMARLTKHDNLNLIILGLISDTNDEILESITELEDFLVDDTEAAFKGRINQIIDLNCIQLGKSIYGKESGSALDSASLRVRKVISCLMKIFARRQLVSSASLESIRFLLVQLFTLSQVPHHDQSLLESLNNLSSAVIDSFEPMNIMHVLTGLLNDPPPSSIVDPIKKAIIRSMRSFK